MKRTVKAAAVMAALTGLFFSCSMFEDLAVPKSVSVKTKGEYAFPLGSAKALLSDHMDAAKLQEIIGDNGGESSISVYDYYDTSDGSNVQKYLLNYPVADIPLDIGKYLEDLDSLDLSSAQNSFSQEIAVPDAQTPAFEKEYTVDINDLIESNFQSNIVVPVTEVDGEKALDINDVDFRITSPNFSTIKFKEGGIELSFEPAEGSSPTATFEISARAVLLVDGSEVSTSGAEGTYTKVITGSTEDNKLVLPLDDKEIKMNMKLQFNARGANGDDPATSLHINKYNVKVGFTSGTKISKITNLTLNDADVASHAVTVENETVDTSSIQAYLKSATIAEGEMNYFIKVPENWSGVSVNPEINITGALNVADSEFKNVAAGAGYVARKKVDLKNKTIFEGGAANIIVNGSVPFSVKNANLELNYDDGGNISDKVVFKAETSITKLSDAAIYIDGFVNTSISKNIEQTLSGDVTKYIKSITFSKVGLEGKIETDLPRNNLKLTPKLDSTFFSISNSDFSESVQFNGTSPYDLSMVKEYGSSGQVVTITDPSTVDFTLDVALEGVDEGGKQLVTFETIELGKTYNLNFDAKFVYDWVSVTINMNEQDLSGTQELGIDLKSFLDSDVGGDFINDNIDKIQFINDSVEGRLYLTRPDIAGLEDLSLKGSISVDWGSGAHDIINNSTGIQFTDFDRTFDDLLQDKYREKRTLLDTDLSGISYEPITGASSLVDMLNAHPANETMNYSFTLGSQGSSDLIIDKEDIDAIKAQSQTEGTVSIKASIAMIIALKLDITDDIAVNDMLETFGYKEEGTNDDFLQRDSAEDGEDFKKFVDLVKEIRMDYNFKNNTGLSLTAKLQAKNSGGTVYLDKDIHFDGKPHALKLTRDDINNIYEASNFPFIPVISMTIEQGTVTVTRDAYLGAQATFTALTDGEYEIWGGDDK